MKVVVLMSLAAGTPVVRAAFNKEVIVCCEFLSLSFSIAYRVINVRIVSYDNFMLFQRVPVWPAIYSSSYHLTELCES